MENTSSATNNSEMSFFILISSQMLNDNDMVFI